jgi:fructuronate reductase/mannitol 2-dehydrogenase
LALAAWFRCARGDDAQGRPVKILHPMATALRERAIEGGSDPGPLLSLRQLFGELGDDPRLVRPLGAWLASLYDQGTRATLQSAHQRCIF